MSPRHYGFILTAGRYGLIRLVWRTFSRFNVEKTRRYFFDNFCQRVNIIIIVMHTTCRLHNVYINLLQALQIHVYYIIPSYVTYNLVLNNY